LAPEESRQQISLNEVTPSLSVQEASPAVATDPQSLRQDSIAEASGQSNAPETEQKDNETFEPSSKAESAPKVNATRRHDSFKPPGGPSAYPQSGQRRFGGSPPKFTVRSEAPAPMPMVGALPIKIPSDHQAFNYTNAIYAYRPISRLAMAYAWRYLRRPVSDGPANILDIESTIALVAHQGFFLSPVYRRWQSNHAHLMFLIDQGGSMIPFQSITKDLIETAQQESSIKQVDVFYFHNFFDNGLYADEYLTKWVGIDQAVESCTTNTSLLIVSDAGAARGLTRAKRIRATSQMLLRLRQQTNLVAWLNPMVRVRWKNSSAQVIADEVQMFQLDVDGFSSAVDALQGRGTVS
jgi:uncharacterized protein with von Willebrand factor type A (vWA) domain